MARKSNNRSDGKLTEALLQYIKAGDSKWEQKMTSEGFELVLKIPRSKLPKDKVSSAMALLMSDIL